MVLSPEGWYILCRGRKAPDVASECSQEARRADTLRTIDRFPKKNVMGWWVSITGLKKTPIASSIPKYLGGPGITMSTQALGTLRGPAVVSMSVVK
jgi:hypothetical protein